MSSGNWRDSGSENIVCVFSRVWLEREPAGQKSDMIVDINGIYLKSD